MSVNCPQCGNDRFRASQQCHGSVPVIACVKRDSSAVFIQNDTDDGFVDTTDLEFRSPEGPFVCAKCDYELLPGRDYAVG